MQISEQTKQELKRYPELERVANSFIGLEGQSEDPRFLPDLIVYWRCMKEKYHLKEHRVFDWDEDTAKDFYTWGHNSRYAHTFWAVLADNPDYYISAMIKQLDKKKSNEKFWKEYQEENK